jgi:hypothetical protein
MDIAPHAVHPEWHHPFALIRRSPGASEVRRVGDILPSSVSRGPRDLYEVVRVNQDVDISARSMA